MAARRAKTLKLDHVAIAVDDLEAAVEAYCSALGTKKVNYETVESEGVRLAIFRLDEGRIELMQPLSDSGPIADYIKKRGQTSLWIDLFEECACTARIVLHDRYGARNVAALASPHPGRQVVHVDGPCGLNKSVMYLDQSGVQIAHPAQRLEQR